MSYINFVEVDAEKLINDLIRGFETAYGTILYPGDERRIFLMQLVPIIVGLKNNINDSANQNLLSNARGSVLDEFGGTKTPRLGAKKAAVTIRFTLSAVQPTNITITQGTRVTPDGNLYFSTTKALTIVAGQTTGDITAEATVAGESYNGYTSGQIKTIVDPVPFVASAVNVDTSAGGADIEPDDDGVNVWSGYRERIRLANESISTAGPEGGYIYWAKTADANIVDVSVDSPTPNIINITVLMKNGGLPQQATLDAVLAQVHPRDRRPMGDNVSALAPTVDSFNITLTYYISKDRITEEAAIRASIENTGGAVDQYKTWQCKKLGRAINPDDLRKFILNAGAIRIDMTSPVYTVVNKSHVAKAGTVTLTYGGLI